MNLYTTPKTMKEGNNHEKTLLHLASGPYSEDYSKLDFERQIHVDRLANLSRSFPKKNSKIRFIGKDALCAIDQLKSENVKIDILVSMNEGLYEGGGNYPIFSGFLMGYLAPLLMDEITLIYNPSYYESELSTPMAKLDWGFAKIRKIEADEADYINPMIFSTELREGGKSCKAQVLRMKKIRNTQTFQLKNAATKISLIHGSIWEDEEILDLIGLSLLSEHPIYPFCDEHRTVASFFKSKNKVLDIKMTSFDSILNYAQAKGLKHIGLCPWLKNDYGSIINRLNQASSFLPEMISFYHLNLNDYKQLYTYFNAPK
jgi:hypothetical protein